jgi:predicted RNA-binding Zn-ribbon protein involved in translation (DUF1610 family)
MWINYRIMSWCGHCGVKVPTIEEGARCPTCGAIVRRSSHVSKWRNKN